MKGAGVYSRGAAFGGEASQTLKRVDLVRSVRHVASVRPSGDKRGGAHPLLLHELGRAAGAADRPDLPAVTKPTRLPSGHQNGRAASPARASVGPGESESRLRTKIWLRPFTDMA